MPNIYLRLPVSRCQYFRHRDPDRTLAKTEPVVFNQYTPEYFILRNSAYNAATIQKVNMQCFSHQQWRNMLNGRHPIGGNVVQKRDASEYLTFGEVEQLNGYHEYDKSSNEDYLCIKLPSEVCLFDTVRPVTPTWNINIVGMRQLIVMLNNDFKRSVVEWALSTFDYCTANGRVVCRSQSAMLERFLMRYGIDPTTTEKDNLRRIIDRWLRTEHNNFRAYSCLDMDYEDDKEKRLPITGVQWE